MTLLSKLKAVLGFGATGDDHGTAVAVEREPDGASEREVKESPPPSRGDGEAGSGSGPVVEGADEPVQSVKGIGPAYAQRLREAGIETVGDLAAAEADELAELTDIGEGRLTGWIDRARAP